MKSRIALAVIASMAALPMTAGAQDIWANSGFYWGADLGQTSTDLDGRGLDRGIEDALVDSGFAVIDGRSETSEDAFTWGLTLGYQIIRYVAVELAYVDLGEAEYKSRLLVSDGIGSGDLNTTVNVASSGPALSAVGTLPIGAGWEVLGRVGMYFGDNDLDVSVDSGGLGESLDDSSSSQSLMWGAGLGYTARQWTVRLEYQQYTDVGDDDGFGEYDVDRITLGAVYRTDFGFHGR
ncbi:MAG: hypothetical protein EHM60_09115 [Lysobacterales bacterium]|jgi:opacity protein-like surface antigen|nr:MAG: hypothetical protein EHM60_09115 [Xanthomonadales bacterium]